MNEDKTAKFETLLRQLEGKRCWNVQAGAIGSMASLHIGAKVLLEKPLPFPNPQLTPEEHKQRGEYVLYIEDCPWRLDGPDAVIASWMDSNAPDGPIVTGLGGLVNRRIERVELTRPGLDLTLAFEGGMVLRVFPDQVDPDEGDNYSLSLVDRMYIVAAGSRLIVEENGE